MAYVQARAGFSQTDALSSVNGVVARTSRYFKQGRLAKTVFALKTAPIGEGSRDIIEDAEVVR